MKTARTIVLDALCRQQRDGAFSNLILDKLLTESHLEQRDKAFAANLFYGVLERQITLDHCIAHYTKTPLRRLDTEVLQILRMGFYQLLYMDAVPDNAAVNESVDLTKIAKKQSARGLVNAILRNFIRDDKEVPRIGSPTTQKSIRYSCPEKLICKWEKEYGEACTEQLLQASLAVPPVYIRVNTQKTDTETLIELLRDEQITAERVDIVDACLRIRGVNGIERSKAYQNGFFYVQDLASQRLCSLIAPLPGETVYDMCAAPGGKSFTLAQYMRDRGTIRAFDLHAQRAALVEKGARRLGLNCIKAKQNDATCFDPSLPQADRVLCDVPCSGYGVIRRKPEIKYKDPDSFGGLPPVQKSILHTASSYVKPGGMLIYSTCTVSRAENDVIAENFLKTHPTFSSCKLESYDDYKHTFLPQELDSDGFFIAMFKKTEQSDE